MENQTNTTIVSIDPTYNIIVKAYRDISILTTKLKIAVEALEKIRDNDIFCSINHFNTADEALIEIKELDNETND